MKQNPLLYSVFGLMVLIFGIVDYRFLNKTLGVILMLLGLGLGIYGLINYRKLKKS
ncbi:hypothetical protein [Paenibacillus sp. 1P07SE]|uniref:hypothetical protein n=1 Tax=Paenibacillus sp. 1P07SE TaxID=3132209 RepID=UPI0039A51814